LNPNPKLSEAKLVLQKKKKRLASDMSKKEFTLKYPSRKIKKTVIADLVIGELESHQLEFQQIMPSVVSQTSGLFFSSTALLTISQLTEE
jgi:hypothetical protein